MDDKNGFEDIDKKLGDGSNFSLNNYSDGMFPVMAGLAKIFLTIVGIILIIVVISEILAK